jgi:threonylcarbamoyladenosine tRNA methylthiotransferase MtaB
MGRNYTRENLFSVINSLKVSIPGITIGGDVIVGFPGEGEEQFKNSYDLIEQSGVHHLHLFPFSARPGTVAAEMTEIISDDIKQERAQILRELGNRLKLQHLNNFINKNIHILFEKRPGNTNGFLTGLSENYLRVNASGDQNKKGLIVEVRPHSIRNNILIADLAMN